MSISLDIHANNVSPLDENSISRATAKQKRHELRRTSGMIMKHERVCDCGQNVVGSIGTIHSTGGVSHFGGVETCGSVWMCPVCAAKVTEGRKEDIDAVLSTHNRAGGVAYMATLTIPHHRFQRCRDLKQAVSENMGGK